MAISGRTDTVSSRFGLLLTVLFLLLSIPAAQAFKLEPMLTEFGPSGRSANQAFRVENDSSNTVAVQISMLTRQIDLEGNETNAPAEDDFLVYPPQVLLKPNQVQTLRVNGWALPSRRRNWPTGFWPRNSPSTGRNKQKVGATLTF
jgi:P pilus assembly chaperone PapD